MFVVFQALKLQGHVVTTVWEWSFIYWWLLANFLRKNELFAAAVRTCGKNINPDL